MEDTLKQVGDSDFEATIKKGVVLVDFYAEWCGPCKMMAPSLAAVAKQLEGQITVVKLNIEHAQKTASKYEVSSVPTLILFRDGEAKGRLVGSSDVKRIKDFIAESNVSASG